MVKGFSDNEVKNNTQNTQNTQIKEKKGLAGFLKGKKFTYTCLLYTSPSPRDRG